MEKKSVLSELHRRLSHLRLDNDQSTQAYKSVSVYPKENELVSPNQAKLPHNIIKGPYKDTYEYLSTHFTLLREDFMKPIRENLISYLKGTDQKLLSIKIHQVHVIRKGVKNSDTCFCFEITEGVTYSTWNLNRNSKRFLTGSLLIFSKDNFETIFCGRITDNKNIVYKKVLVSFDAPIRLKYQQKYLMIECNTFFEPYFHVMKVLQTIRPRTLSMQKYLVEAQSSVDKPQYLKGVQITVSDPKLNKSQLVAIKAALSQELVIIQGPPGTGKTFLGLEIAKKLILASARWYDESPMLIVSVTNHALDQFLEGLIGCTDNILRYGGQSKNPKMDKFSLHKCREHYYETNFRSVIMKRNIALLFKDYRNIENKILTIGNQLDNIRTDRPTCIFKFSVMETGIPEMRRLFLGAGHEKIVSWLLEEDGTMAVKKKEPDALVGLHRIFGLSQDAEKIAAVYKNYLKESHKDSNYCVISVSIIEKTMKKIKDEITEKTQEIEKKKLSQQNQNLYLKVYLREKQRKIEELEETYAYLDKKLDYLKICLNTKFGTNISTKDVDIRNPFNIPVRDRWRLYKHWLSCYGTYLEEKMDLIIDDYKPIYEQFHRAKEENNLNVMRSRKVIGMTTTSAARLHSTIKALKCPIVIVEEAAEVLEAHIIPVLTEHCQHLILIGDHQQLKPSTADYEIGNKYKLGVSLFERMVLNDIQCHTLNVQHRMRPEISSLVTPSIYPILHNHESVETFPQVRGIEKSLYFITHSKREQYSGDSSKKNIHEAQFLIQLAVHLLKNGYGPEEITIITPYLGQVGTLIREQMQSSNDDVKEVKITSVDNFQGEENKIILLSLVRNNKQKKIGFLSIKNRVCVALSRAREGLYIMGNMKQLSMCNELWQKINLTLKAQNALGKALPLKCQIHGKITEVKDAADFASMVPDGGCGEMCYTILLCGHRCKSHCHSDDLLHKKYKCTEPCKRSVCKNTSHKCQKYCYQECGMCLHSLTQKLHCGHHVKCFMEEMGDYRCVEMVYVRLPCGHKESIDCNDVDSDDDYSENVCSTCEAIQQKEKVAVKKIEFEDTIESGRIVNPQIEEETESEISVESDDSIPDD